MNKRFEKLYERRRKANLSYEEIAKLVGISKAYYWQIENKQRRLFYDLAVKIAKVFALNPDDLFYEE